MTVREAAELIGCSPRHVRALIQTGKLRAKTRTIDYGQGGPYRQVWEVQPASAIEYRNQKQSQGWPRGKPRTQGASR